MISRRPISITPSRWWLFVGILSVITITLSILDIDNPFNDSNSHDRRAELLGVVIAAAASIGEEQRILDQNKRDSSFDESDHNLSFPSLSSLIKLEPFYVHMFGHVVNSSNATGGTLIQTHVETVKGQDSHGQYQETITNWDSPTTWPSANSSIVYFQTSIKVYHHYDDDLMSMIFTQRYPHGINENDCTATATTKADTSLEFLQTNYTTEQRQRSMKENKNNNNNEDDEQKMKTTLHLRSNFPALNLAGMHYFSYHGTFLTHHDTGRFPDQRMNSYSSFNNVTLKDGIEAGPLLLFNPALEDEMDNFEEDTNHTDHMNKDKTMIRCGIISHYNQFMIQSMEYTEPTTVQYGPLDTICPLSKSFEAKTIVVFSISTTNPSIILVTNHWGKMLREEYMRKSHHNVRHNPPRTNNDDDDDKDQSYLYRRNHQNDITTRYLGYSTDNGAYYYYHKETDQPVTNNMEETMIAVHDYAKQNNISYRYWLLDSWWYYQSTQGLHAVTNWTARPDVFPHGMKYLFDRTRYYVQAHNRMWSIDNIYQENYDFVKTDDGDVSLPTEYRFWIDLFWKGLEWGLVVYEQDWLNVQFERQSQAFTNETLMRTWLLEMGRAAQDCNLAIQYCMPLSRFILQSAEIPAVTQVRASGDYHATNDEQWNIGITALIYNALDLRPSKDSAWSVTRQPGNRYSVNEPFPEFHALVMAMSTGPVAFSDKIGYSNSTLIHRTCREDGVLLQPAQPLIPIHEWFLRQTRNEISQGHIQESRMELNGLPEYAVVLALELDEDFPLQPHHLYRFNEEEASYIVYDRSLSYISQSFRNGTPLVLQKSKSRTPEDYQLYFIAPALDDWCLLGELHKFVPLSKGRFLSVDVNPKRMKIVLEGSSSESVEIAYAVLKSEVHWEIQKITVQIPVGGTTQVTINK